MFELKSAKFLNIYLFGSCLGLLSTTNSIAQKIPENLKQTIDARCVKEGIDAFRMAAYRGSSANQGYAAQQEAYKSCWILSSFVYDKRPCNVVIKDLIKDENVTLASELSAINYCKSIRENTR